MEDNWIKTEKEDVIKIRKDGNWMEFSFQVLYTERDKIGFYDLNRDSEILNTITGYLKDGEIYRHRKTK